MSQECGKLLFHISRKNDWEIGNEIVTGGDSNEFWRRCREYSPQIELNDGVVVSFWDIMKMFRTSRIEASQEVVDFLYEQLSKISTKYAFYVREQVFETVRKECFPLLPSRKKCLWLTDKENLGFWATIDDNTQRSLLELEVYGEVFCADEHWLAANTFSSHEYEDRAKHYWKGEMSEKPRLEYLLYGQAKIKKIIPFQKNSELLNL